jgi:hypothetical protein
MESPPPVRRNRQRCYNRLARRRNRLARRLRFLLLGLKLIHPFGLPLEKMAIVLIQECVDQIWPQPERLSGNVAAYSHRRALVVSPSAQPGNARGV